jgi:hypothetical protein
MAVKQRLSAALLGGLVALTAGCAEFPDRLDNLADAGREFAVVHPVVTRTALRKPQHLRLECDSHCLVRQ